MTCRDERRRRPRWYEDPGGRHGGARQGRRHGAARHAEGGAGGGRARPRRGDAGRRRRRQVDRARGRGRGCTRERRSRCGTVVQAPNIDGWTDSFPLGPVLSERLARPRASGTTSAWRSRPSDASAPAAACDSFLGVFWGTGIGGGLVVDGRVLQAAGRRRDRSRVRQARWPTVRLRASRLRRGVRGAPRARGAGPTSRASARRPCSILQHKRGREALTSGVWLRALDAGDAGRGEPLDEAVEALGVASASTSRCSTSTPW